MITEFKIYENNNHFKENINKFFFKRYSEDSKYINLCLLLNVNTILFTDKVKLKILHIPIVKKTKTQRYSYLYEEQKLEYTYNTWHKLKFLTAKELFENDTELFSNLWMKVKDMNDDYSTMYTRNTHIKILKDLMREFGELCQITNKYNL